MINGRCPRSSIPLTADERLIVLPHRLSRHVPSLVPQVWKSPPSHAEGNEVFPSVAHLTL
jgi:hypothetical protein